MFEGSSQARKGKITAKNDDWRDQKEQGSLTSYFNQPAARALAHLPVHKHALGGFLVLMDLHGPVSGESRSPTSLSASMLSACGVVALAASALVAVAPAAAAAAAAAAAVAAP